MNKENIEKKIVEMLEQLRPYLNSDGGDLEFVKFEDGYVYVRLYGSCVNCMYKDYTIQDNLFETIKAEIPEVKGVINVEL